MSSELDFHSQNMETLIKDNDEMRVNIKKLRKELSEHAEVEIELAKRSHFCQRVIKKYRT